MAAISRQTVDLSAYPDLVVIYLGMAAHSLRGMAKLIGIGPRIEKAAAAKPDGLLHHEGGIVYGFFPLHVGMRQYWRDLESLEKWTRESPHLDWWKDLMKREQGVSFWHETYSVRGGFESVFLNAKQSARPGFLGFAPNVDAEGAMFSARRRLKRETAQ